MGKYNEILPLTVYSPDRKTSYGVIPEVLEYTKTIRFNAASEIQFSVTQKYYDINKECWVTNPIYDKLVEDHLIYTPDNNDYFTFPIREIGDDKFYCVDENNLPIRYDAGAEHHRYNASGSYKNFTLQQETELFDIGARDGYSFPMASLLSAQGNYYSTGDNTTEGYYKCRACETFIPVKHGDIIYMGSYNDSQLYYKYRFCTYEKDDSTSFIGCNSNFPNTAWEDFKNGAASDAPFERYSKSVRIAVNKNNPLTPFENGFVRFSYFSVPDDGLSHYVDYGYIKIFSGERRCSHISNTDKSGEFSPKLKWFVITNVEEVDDGINKKKTITAYSYEYTLSKRTFSLSSSALSFYIPPAIIDLVESDKWIVDKYDNRAGTVLYTRSPQVMQKGILNQLLDFLPNWKIGYVSSELMTKVRTIEEVDNANIYSFCMDNLQSAYQCYFVFDSVNQTISAYDYNDINMFVNCGVSLTWDNVIKEVKTTNTDTTYANAMRIHTAEDKYSVGLVNPTGNNVVYDFTHIKPYVDFVADRERTVAEALTEWELEYNNQSKNTTFQGQCITYIRNIMQEIQYSSKLSMALSKYRAKAEVINMHLQDDKNSGKAIELSYLVGDTPRTESSMTTGSHKPKDNYENYHSKYLYDALLDLSRDYYTIYAQLNDVKASLNAIKDAKKTLAEKFAIDPRMITNNSILSKAEAQAVFPYIKEGDWTNANVIFSETYSAEDIYNTLVDVYNESYNDLKNILSSPQYEFNIGIVNILKLPEMNQHKDNLRLGKKVSLEISTGKWVSPTLLEIFIDYVDENNTTLQFSTDYKRKPLYSRFADLFRTITQTSVKQSDFTFED